MRTYTFDATRCGKCGQQTMKPTDEVERRVHKTMGGDIPYEVRTFRCSDPNCAHEREIEEKYR